MKIPPKVKINIDDAATLLLFAFRYVLGRMTYAPGLWVDIYKYVSPQLSEQQQTFLKDRLKTELEQAFRYEEHDPDYLGWKCDRDLWHNFYNDCIKEASDE